MDNQATVMDPLFKKIGQTQFNDDDWAALTAGSTKIQATSLKIKDFSKGAEFDALAMKLNQSASELSNSYASKDATAANTALTNMKATCKECHKKFR
jgi:cytochrome c556